MVTYEQWAAERLVPGGSVTMHEARADYVGWCSDRRLRWEPRSKQRALVRGLGAVVRGRGDETRYEGVSLVGPMPDSGYRVMAQRDMSGGDPMAALGLLAGMVPDSRALDVAYLRLSGLPGNTCVACGYPTRHEDRHMACEGRPAVLIRYCREQKERTG